MPAMLDHAHHVLAGPGLPATLLLSGLVGGALHCGAMCGPFVLAQLDPKQGAGGPALLRALLLPYQFGRITTYAALGGAAGWLGDTLVRASELEWLGAAFLGLAALMLVLRITPRLGHDWLLPLTRLAGQGFPLGLALGFLPCGLSWAALVAAAGAGSALGGAVAMAAFGLGTVPGLVVAGVAGLGLRRWARRFLEPALLLNALGLVWLAARALQGIPR